MASPCVLGMTSERAVSAAQNLRRAGAKQQFGAGFKGFAREASVIAVVVRTEVVEYTLLLVLI